jgi:hypothetical protein
VTRRPASGRHLLLAAALVAAWAGTALAAPRPVAALAVALVANPDSLTMAHDRTAVVPAPGVMANDVVLLDTTSVLDKPPGHGTVVLAADGGYRYTPDPGFVGSDSFEYHDTGLIPSNKAKVAIHVTNAKPVANDDAYAATTGVTLTVPAPGVLANDDDADGDPMTATIVNNGGNGNLSLSANGGFTYKSGGSFVGTRTFTYRVSDGVTTSAEAKVTITVRAAASTPTPVPTPTPTPVPTPTPRPTLPLPSLPLPTLPLPTLPLPTLFPTPTPTRSPDPGTSATPAPSERPTPRPSGSPAPSNGPAGSAAPPSDGPGSTPAPSQAVPGVGTTGSGGGNPPIDGGLTVGHDQPAPIDGLVDPGVVGLDGLIEWAVPSLVLSVPGLLLILAVLAQAVVGTLWIPVIRRWLGTFGVRRQRSPGRAAG